jgi:hypothetical protein
MPARILPLSRQALAALPTTRALPLRPTVAHLSRSPAFFNPRAPLRAEASLHTSARRYNVSTPTSTPKLPAQEPPRNTPKGPAAFAGIQPVELAYDVVQPVKIKQGNDGQCMVICHGLLYVRLSGWLHF